MFRVSAAVRVSGGEFGLAVREVRVMVRIRLAHSIV